MAEITPGDVQRQGRDPASPDRHESEPTDHALLDRIVQRDLEAFDLLVERYQERAYRLAWHFTRDREAAKDLSQEAFIKVYQAAHTFKGHAKFSTWFFRILVNLCFDSRRKAARGRRLVLAQEPEEISALDLDLVESLNQEQQMAQLWTEVDTLSPQQRAVLLLQVQEGMGTREIAQVLKLQEATVRVHLHRALTSLRTSLSRGSA
jgi:RNA polymerase sigma-70 factor (ECF subfamily)